MVTKEQNSSLIYFKNIRAQAARISVCPLVSNLSLYSKIQQKAKENKNIFVWHPFDLVLLITKSFSCTDTLTPQLF